MSWVSDIGPLSLRNMRYFVAFVESGTIGGAAASVGSSAAVLRSRMKSLSDALGWPLFERSGSEFKLTEAGTRLFLVCKETLAQLDGIQKDIKAAHDSGLVAGCVRIGIDPGVARILMSSVILPLLAEHPRLDIVAREASGPMLHSWLEEGMIDLAIGLPSVRHWWITELASYEERPVLCSLNPLPDGVSLSELPNREDGETSMFACYRLSFNRPAMFDAKRPPLQVNGVLTSMAFVRRGTWCAVVPISAVLEEVEAGSLHIRQIGAYAPDTRMIARHTDKPLNEGAELIVSALGDLLPDLAARVAAQLDRAGS